MRAFRIGNEISPFLFIRLTAVVCFSFGAKSSKGTAPLSSNAGHWINVNRLLQLVHHLHRPIPATGLSGLEIQVYPAISQNDGTGLGGYCDFALAAAVLGGTRPFSRT
jgi:hypothetical protein